MVRRCLFLVILALALVVPAEAACCAGVGGCPTTAAPSSDCCATAVDDAAAKRCCDEAATPEQSLVSAKSHGARLAAMPPAAMGLEIKATTGVDRDGQHLPSLRLHEPLYTLHSVLLI